MMNVEAAERYVAAGAALLDEKGPENWRGTLYAERGRLDMGHPNHCVLGILYGSWGAVVNPALAERPLDNRVDWDNNGEFGFNTLEGEDLEDEDDYASYAELRDAWLDEIEPPEDPDQDRDLGLI